ncbi:hypothetical protein HAX54_046636 [Datura stramonium]|uniref:Uncharacterized protein n=1 Tax=Datura stramonium TaxID=4076 RepID=A0ABS8WL21_DATST|nr:hypothetical protein [Datura stramonium]
MGTIHMFEINLGMMIFGDSPSRFQAKHRWNLRSILKLVSGPQFLSLRSLVVHESGPVTHRLFLGTLLVFLESCEFASAASGVGFADSSCDYGCVARFAISSSHDTNPCFTVHP